MMFKNVVVVVARGGVAIVVVVIVVVDIEPPQSPSSHPTCIFRRTLSTPK